MTGPAYGIALAATLVLGIAACDGSTSSAPPTHVTIDYILLSIDGVALPITDSSANPPSTITSGNFELMDGDSASTTEETVRTEVLAGAPPFQFGAIAVDRDRVAITGTQIVVSSIFFGIPPDTGTYSDSEMVFPHHVVSSGATKSFRYVRK